ncbi:MAG: S1 family peptidase [Actinocatenispora sp.]
MSKILRSARVRRLGILFAAVLAAVLLMPAAAFADGGDVRTMPLYGGMFIQSGSTTCVSAFNVKAGTSYYVLTSGGCTSIGGEWTVHGVDLGPTAASSFPGNDYGLIQVANPVWQPQPAVLSAQGSLPILGYGSPPVGAEVCTTNETSPVYCDGTIQAVNVTVSLPGGVITGLVQVGFAGCVDTGAGAPVFSGKTAVGIAVAASGNCSGGGTLYYQPIGEVMAAYGLSLV